MNTFSLLTLPGDRKLGYTQFGNLSGYPVFYFHGTPSSSNEALLIGNDVFERMGLRIIAANRPGIGESGFQQNRRFENWPDDVIALADHLGLDKFSIIGNSGGGPYVIACAAMIPHRLDSAIVISGGWQMNTPAIKKHLKFPYSVFWFVAARLPFLLPLLLSSMKRSSRSSREKELAQAKKMMAAPDYEAVSKGDRVDILSQVITEALKNKSGVIHDIRLFIKDLGIELGKIDFPVMFFHGEQDRNLPLVYARQMISRLPNATLHTFPDDAHLSTLCNHFEMIVANYLPKRSVT